MLDRFEQFSAAISAQNTNALAELMTNSDPFWRILTVGICAPIFEELILRKFLIDRIHKYGEGIAEFASEAIAKYVNVN